MKLHGNTATQTHIKVKRESRKIDLYDFLQTVCGQNLRLSPLTQTHSDNGRRGSAGPQMHALSYTHAKVVTNTRLQYGTVQHSTVRYGT